MRPYAGGTLAPPTGVFTLAGSPQSLRTQPKVEQDGGGGRAGRMGGAPRLSASVCQNINGKLSR